MLNTFKEFYDLTRNSSTNSHTKHDEENNNSKWGSQEIERKLEI